MQASYPPPAPWHYGGIAQGRILGRFDNEYSHVFEYAARTEADGDWAAKYPHVVFMSDGSKRFATVKKTVVHIVIDEAADGQPVVEKWSIKRRAIYW